MPQLTPDYSYFEEAIDPFSGIKHWWSLPLKGREGKSLIVEPAPGLLFEVRRYYPLIEAPTKNNAVIRLESGDTAWLRGDLWFSSWEEYTAEDLINEFGRVSEVIFEGKDD